jgi:anaerobic magnesium-protoporphyrin IX monomethyl ester cyclase
MFLFINLNQRNVEEFIMNRFRPAMPPFGIAYVSALLRESGYRCKLHDNNLREYTEQQLRNLFRRHAGELQAVGLTSVSITLGQLARVARISKEELPEVPVIVGGPHARLLPAEILEIPEVDVVFTSEAELSILEYARADDLRDVSGIMYRQDGQLRENPVGAYLHDLDQIPYPDYSLFDIAEYHTTKGIGKRQPSSYIITSRGCPFKCTFCSSKALNPTGKKTVRFRSAENVLGEIEMLVKRYGVREVFFSDDMFTGNTKHLVGICEGLIERDLDVIWVCMTHVNAINREKLKLMKRAGCHQVCFGIEAGDPEIQRIINKNIDFEKAKKVVRMTQAAGMDARCSFMFGNQNETPQTLQRSIDLAKELKPDFASFNIATPYPGTEFRDWAVEHGYLANDDYAALDSTSYILETPDLPKGTVEKYCEKAFRSFYYTPTYVFRRLRHIRDGEDALRYAKSACYAATTLPDLGRKLWRAGKRRVLPASAAAP